MTWPIGVEDVTSEDLDWLQGSCKLDWAGLTPAAVVRHPEVQLWRIADGTAARGIAITKINNHAEGRELFLWHVAGDPGIAEGLALEFFETLEKFAAACDCRWVRSIPRPGGARMMERRFGYKRTHVVVRKEIQ